MTTLVFVHGTGVRTQRYPAVWPHLRRRLAAIRPWLEPVICPWGVEHGTRRGQDEPAAAAAATPEASPVDNAVENEVRLWGQLYADPSWELAILVEEALHTSAPPRVPGQPLPGADIRPRAEALTDRLSAAQRDAADPLLAEAAEVGLDAMLADAVRAVFGRELAETVIRYEDVLGGRVRPALARAVAAEAVRRAGGPETVVLDGMDAGRLADRLTTELGGTPMGPRGWLVKLALGMILPHVQEALGPLTSLGARRGNLERLATRYAGDVLVYLARGEAIRNAVADFVSRQKPPVYLMGHSLGGIVCFDLLAAGRLPGVELLLTVGSQVAYLYDIDALPGHCRAAGPLPKLPRWVNVYDDRDLVSFPAQPVLPPGVVTDYRVDNGAPFPMSHLAYFRSGAFYDILHAEVP